MSVGHRIAITFAIVFVILFALSLVGCLSGRWDAEAQQSSGNLYEGAVLDSELLLRLDKRALDEAYVEQVKKLFGVWLIHQAPPEATQIINGLRIARRAYNQAATQIAKREAELMEKQNAR